MIDIDTLKNIANQKNTKLNSFSDLVGRTIVKIVGKKHDEEVFFTLSNGKVYKLHHEQICCESVLVEDVIGDWEAICNSPVIKAEESTSVNGEGLSEYDDSFTWTFYHISTFYGTVAIRFYGSSNGYYSESVGFSEVL